MVSNLFQSGSSRKSNKAKSTSQSNRKSHLQKVGGQIINQRGTDILTTIRNSQNRLLLRRHLPILTMTIYGNHNMETLIIIGLYLLGMLIAYGIMYGSGRFCSSDHIDMSFWACIWPIAICVFILDILFKIPKAIVDNIRHGSNWRDL